MIIPDQNTRKKKDIRALILNAARSLFVQEGYHSTSIRKIASRIGYSPTTIYLYYEDKSDIVYSLHKEGFGLMKNLFISLANVESPFERLKAIGRTYLQFAREHPDYYELMFMLREPMDHLNAESRKKSWEEGKEVFNLLVSTIADCQRDGYFPENRSEYAALQAWSMVHGLCSLYITTRLQKVGEELLSNESSDFLLESAFKAYADLMEQIRIMKR